MAAISPGRDVDRHGVEGLFVALRGQTLCGAAWAQRQPGNIAIFWPPQLVLDEEPATAHRLAESVVRKLDRFGVAMSQVVLPSEDTGDVPILKAVGFRQLADLLYLACESDRFPSQANSQREIEFLPYDNSLRDRLVRVIERTYDGTLDCAALNGTRHMDDVMTGYQSTGVFRPENWLIVHSGDDDVGALLLADHPSVRHWELVYMGLVPKARGRGWGRQITQHAQALARAAGVERIVLAADAANEPALRMYRSVGFEAWDRRTVFVRFSANSNS
jgi:ribosomal protein S18 acetylase RimI-like enzyme